MQTTFNKTLKWMPIILFLLLLMVDRNNILHVFGYLTLLFSYTFIIIIRILYAKKEWHEEFNKDQLNQNSSIKNMSDFKKKKKYLKHQKGSK
jgi:membrane protein YdbS with pleckstrin-like domain